MFKKGITWDQVILAMILALAGFLSLYAVWNEGYGNQYYAAAVKSMLTSFHNFFFVSFDGGGFVSVDKPPLGLWIQALSALIFGFQGWSLILPQALAAVISTALVYHLVRRSFGNPAGLIAALVFALTPILAAVSRTNNFDTMVVLFVLLAAWADTGRCRARQPEAAAVKRGAGGARLQHQDAPGLDGPARPYISSTGSRRPWPRERRSATCWPRPWCCSSYRCPGRLSST